MAIVTVTVSFMVRSYLVDHLGLELPLFLTFYPAVVIVSILAGLMPALLATALVVVGVAFWILPPTGNLPIPILSDVVALTAFSGMCVFMSFLAEQWRRSRRQIADFRAEQARLRGLEELRQLSESKRVAIEGAGLGVWDIRLATREISMDDFSRRMAGLQSGDRLEDREIFERVHPDDRAPLLESFRQAVSRAESNPWHQEFRIYWPDGSMHWLLVHGRAYFADQPASGRAERFIGVTMDITTRKLAEQSAEEFRAKLEVALASMTDSVLICDTSGRLIHMNEALAGFYRFKNKDECAHSLAEFQSISEASLPDGQLVPVDQWLIPRALRGETLTQVEFNLHRKDTGDSWIGSYSASPLRQADGSIVGAVVVARDITEQKRQQRELEDYRQHLERRVAEQTKELRASEERYRGLFANLPIGTVVQAADGHIIDANQAACEILRINMDQLCGRTSLDPAWKALRADGSPFPGAEHPAMVSLATGKPQQGVVMGVGEPDDRSWISINSHPLFHEGEARPYAVITSFMDITKRIRDEEVIAALNRQYQDVLSAATEVAIIATDLRGVITLFNVGAELMLGYLDEEVVGRETPEIFHIPDEFEALAAELSQKLGTQLSGVDAVMATVRKQGSFRKEWTFLRRDGSQVEVSASITPVRSPQDETTGYLAVLQDITDKARLEEILRQSARNDHLTGLANRRVFEEAIDLEFKRMQRFRSASSVMMIDIDHFKSVNDSFGHETGDRALGALARVLKRTARSTDMAARFGGDEFVLLLVGTGLNGAMVIAEQVRKAIAELSLDANQKSFTVTVSIGVSSIAIDDQSWADGLRRADSAMYRAKSAGRNRVLAAQAGGSGSDFAEPPESNPV